MSLTWTLVEKYSRRDLLYACTAKSRMSTSSNAVVASVTKDFKFVTEY